MQEQKKGTSPPAQEGSEPSIGVKKKNVREEYHTRDRGKKRGDLSTTHEKDVVLLAKACPRRSAFMTGVAGKGKKIAEPRI